MVNSTQFAERLEKILDYYGVSATAFSETIDMNRSTISHLLSGRNKPSLDFILKVIQHYPEVDLYWFLNGKGKFPSTPSTPLSADTLDKPEKKQSVPAVEAKPSSESTETPLPASDSDKNIDRIVVFYSDGSFKSYEN